MKPFPTDPQRLAKDPIAIIPKLHTCYTLSEAWSGVNWADLMTCHNIDIDEATEAYCVIIMYVIASLASGYSFFG